MSIRNRNVKTDERYTVNYENKWRTILGKVACLFRGHVPVRVFNDLYCISCWKKLSEVDE